jgi:hypothetical protein
MKFTRRPDLAPQTRIEIVKLVWLYQGVYGKMTAIAHLSDITDLSLSTAFDGELSLPDSFLSYCRIVV